MPSTKFTRQDILDIVANADGLSLDALAARYDTNVKTVLRYLTGESGWAITGIEKPAIPEAVVSLPPKIASLLKHGIDAPTLRAYYGFALTGPLMWGVCDAWDGTCFIATDGIIAWRDKQLSAFVARRGGCELPSLGVSRIMCLSLGDAIPCPPLAPNHIRVIESHRLQVHEAVCGSDLLYLTRISRKNGEEPSSAHVVISLC